jgi:hypothetical protein
MARQPCRPIHQRLPLRLIRETPTVGDAEFQPQFAETSWRADSGPTRDTWCEEVIARSRIETLLAPQLEVLGTAMTLLCLRRLGSTNDSEPSVCISRIQF